MKVKWFKTGRLLKTSGMFVLMFWEHAQNLQNTDRK